jgi:hypothetical protein
MFWSLHRGQHGSLHTGQRVVLKVTLTDVIMQNCGENLLIASRIFNLLDKIDLTVLWVLRAEVLGPLAAEQFLEVGTAEQ